MPTLELKRLRFSSQADIRLKALKARTGLIPNILCRLALTLSLHEPGNPDPELYDENSSREINRYTLLGELDNTLTALLLQRCHSLVQNGEDLGALFRAHTHRGIDLLYARVRHLEDLGNCIPNT